MLLGTAGSGGCWEAACCGQGLYCWARACRQKGICVLAFFPLKKVPQLHTCFHLIPEPLPHSLRMRSLNNCNKTNLPLQSIFSLPPAAALHRGVLRTPAQSQVGGWKAVEARGGRELPLLPFSRPGEGHCWVSPIQLLWAALCPTPGLGHNDSGLWAPKMEGLPAPQGGTPALRLPGAHPCHASALFSCLSARSPLASTTVCLVSHSACAPSE